MPTISAHVDDETAAIIEAAARSSQQKRVGPWLGEAARQRLDREGLTSEAALAKAEILAIAEEVGPTRALETLRRSLRAVVCPEKPAA